MESLHDAAPEGDLEKGRSLCNINPALDLGKADNGHGPLHLAAYCGSTDAGFAFGAGPMK